MGQVTSSNHPGLVGVQPEPTEQALPNASSRRQRVGGFPVSWLVAPSVLWLLIFLVIPLISIFVFSLWTSTGYGLEPGFNIGNYGEYFSSEGFFDPEHRNFLKLRDRKSVV